MRALGSVGFGSQICAVQLCVSDYGTSHVPSKNENRRVLSYTSPPFLAV